MYPEVDCTSMEYVGRHLLHVSLLYTKMPPSYFTIVIRVIEYFTSNFWTKRFSEILITNIWLTKRIQTFKAANQWTRRLNHFC